MIFFTLSPKFGEVQSISQGRSNSSSRENTKARETFTTERLVERREDGVSKLKKGQRAEQSDERNEESSVSYLLIYQREKLEF